MPKITKKLKIAPNPTVFDRSLPNFAESIIIPSYTCDINQEGSKVIWGHLRLKMSFLGKMLLLLQIPCYSYDTHICAFPIYCDYRVYTEFLLTFRKGAFQGHEVDIF